MTQLNKDEAVYEELFNSHKSTLGFIYCQECSSPITNQFRDKEGRVLCRFAYSHIKSKASSPELRHDVSNFNILCLECHQKWEQGDRKAMKIYKP